MYNIEIWKDVPNYEGVYQVSSLGNIRRDNKPLKLFNTGTRYLGVNLTNKGIRKRMNVHVLVAIAFLNHKPNGHNSIVDHINNDPLDNRLSNLQITTQRKNLSKDKKNKTSKYTGVSKFNSKWKSQIRINGKKVYLGLYNTEEEAHEAYKKALCTSHYQEGLNTII